MQIDVTKNGEYIRISQFVDYHYQSEKIIETKTGKVVRGD